MDLIPRIHQHSVKQRGSQICHEKVRHARGGKWCKCEVCKERGHRCDNLGFNQKEKPLEIGSSHRR